MLGTGFIAERLADAFTETRRATLVAIASRSLERAEAFAQKHDIHRAYPSYDELLADTDIEAVLIALPNALHAHWTICAAEAKKHVLCEKPLALNANECTAMIDACGANGVLLMEAAMYRFQPQIEHVLRLIDDGAIGEPRLFYGAFCFPFTDTSNIRYNKSLGGGCLFDIGFYPVDFAKLIAGAMPDGAVAFAHYHPECDVEIIAGGSMHFPTGMIALFECAFQTDVRTYVEIIGDEAEIQMPDPWTSRGTRKEVLLIRQREVVESFDLPDPNSYALEIDHFSECIRTGTPPHIAPESSRDTVAILEMLSHTARCHRQR